MAVRGPAFVENNSRGKPGAIVFALFILDLRVGRITLCVDPGNLDEV